MLTESTKTRFFAHRRDDDQEWQPLGEHLQKTAELARAFGKDAGVAELAYVAGLFHDLGKYSQEFQERLRGGPRVDHSTAGAKELQHLLKGTPQEAFASLLAYPILGHHAGLPDYGNETDLEGSTVCARLKREVPDYKAYKNELNLNDLSFSTLPIRPQKKDPGFSIAFLIRMVYSALVDADFQETETYIRGAQPRGEYDDIPTLLERLNLFLRRFENPTSEINRKRTETLNACIKRGQTEKPGFFSLTVPTGGGKTLASMAFALHHAATNGLKRIIYVLPFTTIIEQNAEVFRQIFGDHNVLEHHSNVEWEERNREIADDCTNNAIIKLKLAAENWDIPIVVTTNVQFFESLFANKASRCRKVHNIAKSVIILDEAQMLPRGYLRPAMAALWELVTNYGASVVFCTATQPRIECFLPEPVEIKELVPNPPSLFAFYKRVQVENLGTLTDEELVDRLNAHEQALCIVNTRRHASGLFGALQGEGNFHLSTLMCPVHRKEKLAEIRKRLKAGEPCRVVSTTVMEAGIDIDFPVGYRALSGLDSINQAAGRVNREMKRNACQLFVFEPQSPHIKRLPTYIKQAAEVTRLVLRNYPAAPISIPAVRLYFEKLYALQNPQIFDYKKILDCFNSKEFRFFFKKAAQEFRVIEDDTKTIIIPYDERARELLEALKFTQYPFSILRKLQPYTVSIFGNEFERLGEKGVIQSINDICDILCPDCIVEYYNSDRGLLIPESDGGEGLFF